MIQDYISSSKLEMNRIDSRFKAIENAVIRHENDLGSRTLREWEQNADRDFCRNSVEFERWLQRVSKSLLRSMASVLLLQSTSIDSYIKHYVFVVTKYINLGKNSPYTCVDRCLLRIQCGAYDT